MFGHLKDMSNSWFAFYAPTENCDENICKLDKNFVSLHDNTQSEQTMINDTMTTYFQKQNARHRHQGMSWELCRKEYTAETIGQIQYGQYFSKKSSRVRARMYVRARDFYKTTVIYCPYCPCMNGSKQNCQKQTTVEGHAPTACA